MSLNRDQSGVETTTYDYSIMVICDFVLNIKSIITTINKNL